jgi:ABC-type multidrug transport system fused ATPase/permease subunit
MNRLVMSISAKANAPSETFGWMEFKRIFRRCCEFKGTLFLGVLATIVFAALHTMSVSAAFPVFKILLEEEGLHGWLDRTLAGHRLGGEFPPATDLTRLRVLKVSPHGPLAAAGVGGGHQLWDDAGTTPVALLHRIAGAGADEALELRTDADAPDPSTGRTVTVRLESPDTPIRILQRLGSWLPARAAGDSYRTLVYLLLGLVVVVVAANIFRYYGEIMLAKAVLRAMMHLRAEVYERILHLPMSYFASRSTADMVGRLVQDIQEIQRGMITFFSKFLREPLSAVCILAWALTLDWRLTLTTLVVAPVAAGLFWWTGKRVKRANRKLLHNYGEMIGALTASLQSLRIVKAYTAEEHERSRLRAIDERVLRQQVRLAKLEALISPAMETLAVFAASLLALWFARQVLDHEMTPARFGALGVAVAMLFGPIRKLTDVYVRVQRSTAGAERVFQVIDHPIETEADSNLVELQPLARGIEYVNVSFTYPGADRPAVSEVSLFIGKGETIAIVGPNGCGKTTLVSLLPRFFDPDRGEIRYDGLDVRRASLHSLRRQIGLVTQEAVIFAGTPVENIAYGEALPDRDRVLVAARRAYADDFIRNHAGGFDAMIGERGTTISGGQRQRLAIARAIFRDAPILVFDEATSQIDSESELKIQEALREFARHRTTLIIAHRLSTIQFADRIVVMDQGRVIDAGSHRELFDRCPLYRNLCETQFVNE